MKLALLILLLPSLLCAQGSFSSIIAQYSKKEYVSGQDVPVTKLLVTPSINEETRTASWFQSQNYQAPNDPMGMNSFHLYDVIREATFDLNFIAQRERYEYNIRRLYDSVGLQQGNTRAKTFYSIQEQLRGTLETTILNSYSQAMVDVLRSMGYKVDTNGGQLAIDDASVQEFSGSDQGFKFAGQQMNVGDQGRAILVTPNSENNRPKLLFRFLTITGGLQPNGAGQPKYDTSYRFNWATEEGFYLLQGQFRHMTPEGYTVYLPQMPLTTYDIFGTRFGPIYRLRDALNLYDHPSNQIPSAVCTHWQEGENLHLFNTHKATLITNLAGRPVKTLDDIKAVAESDYAQDERMAISIYTPRKQGQVIPVQGWHNRSFHLEPDTHAIQVARDRRVEEERMKEQAKQEVMNQEHQTRLDMDKAHQEELYQIAKQREKERHERRLEIISREQTKFIPELKLMAEEDPRIALSFFKYLYDHVPEILTSSQCGILSDIFYAKENFVIESRPLNVRNLDAEFPVDTTELNTKYQSVGIAEGEMVLYGYYFGIWLVVPIESPDALVEKLLKGDSSRLALEELFQVSRFGGGVFAKGYDWFQSLDRKPIIDDGYRQIVVVEDHLRPYGRKFYPPAIFQSKLVQAGAVVWGGAVVLAQGITIAEELQNAEYDYGDATPEKREEEIDSKSFGKIYATEKHPETGTVTRKRCDYKASNGKVYTLVYSRTLKSAFIGFESEGWEMSKSFVNPALPGYDYYRVCPTKEELAVYIEEVIAK